MQKEEFLKLFSECLGDKTIELVLNTESSECFGDTISLEIYIGEQGQNRDYFKITS